MKAEAIIFDKDGTLMDFDSFWVSVSEKAIERVLEALGTDTCYTEAILEALGVRDGETDLDGALCKGTYEEIGEIVYGMIKDKGCTASSDIVVKMVTDAYNNSVEAGEIKPTCEELGAVLRELKARGIALAVVTTDNAVITERCLRTLGIYELFDKIYTDDGNTPTKPDPFCALDLMKRMGVGKESALMVGDTMTDVRFARNADISVIGVASKAKNRALLAPVADAVINDMTELIFAMGRIGKDGAGI